MPNKFKVSKYIRDALPWEKKENLARLVDNYLFNEFDSLGGLFTSGLLSDRANFSK